MSSWHLHQLKYAFGLGGLFSFYGMAAFITWFLGEYFGWNRGSRIIVIAMVLITMPIALVANHFVARRSKKKEEKEKAEKEAAEGGDGDDAGDSDKVSKPSGNYEDVDKGASEVISFLKGSNLGTSGDALYSLPWYLVTGANKSGKTSLVLGSDLNFQSLPSQRQSELKVIRPTRHVDWRVTSDAVFVDLPGRFQSENSDGDEWASLIETVKKHRSKRPVDGLLLTVNTENILHSDEKEIEELAKTVRTRLDDATKRLKTKFPVYLVFTHADAIEGFRDSFSKSKKEGENLVWGSTFPLEKSDNAQSLFDGEYEILQDSVMKRRLIRLSAPFSPLRQLRIFNFPLHFGSARRKLGTFVTTLFRPNPFSESPFLRGFYFTAVPVNRKRSRRNKKPTGVPQTVGETFFTKKFFKDVVLRDRDLVKTFHDQRQKPPILGWFLTFIGAFILTVLLSLAGFSLYRNYKFVQDASEKGQAVLVINKRDANTTAEQKGDTQAQEELNSIEDLRKILVVLDDYERNGAPIYMRFGLYSGNKIYRQRLLNIYYNAIQKRFRDPTITKLKAELSTFANNTSNADPTNLTEEQEKILGKHYNLLEAYLMLSNEHKDRAVPSTLSQTLKDYWINESKIPKGPGNREIAENQLNFYFKQIDRVKSFDNDKSAFPREPLDTLIVNKTREKLKSYPAYLRYLRRVITGVSKRVDEVTVDTLLDGRGQGVISGTHKIPGAFTIEGYRSCPSNEEEVTSRCVKDAIAKANEELSKEDWVMGVADANAQAKADEISKLQERYFNLYTENWRELIRRTKVKDFKQLDDMKKGLRAFSSAESPMKILLLEVAKNTKFSSKPKAKGWTDISWISDWWNGVNTGSEDENVIPVENEFEALFKFVGIDNEDEKVKALIDTKYSTQMTRLTQVFGKISASEKRKVTTEIEQKDPESTAYTSLDTAENKIDDVVKNFQSSAEQDIAVLLKEPVNQIRNLFGADAITQLKKDWNQVYLPKAKQIERGYPFTNEGESDLTELSKFLNPADGEFSNFYKERLEKHFEEQNNTLVIRETSKDLNFSPEFVAYVNNIFKLRDILYGKSNKEPNFKYDFRLLPVKNAIIEVVIDGQKVTSDTSTGSSTLGFPAQQGKSSGVLMRFATTGDTSSTSGATLPPTSSANNSNSSVTTTSPGVSNFLQDSNEDSKTFQGTWGLFKFVDSGSKVKDGDTYTLSYKLGGKTVKATIKPQGGDLFDRSVFTKIKAPSTIMQ